MKPVAGLRRVSHYYALKRIFAKMVSQRALNLIPNLHVMQAGAALHLLKILSVHFRLQLLLRELSMKKTMPLHRLWLHCIMILRQARLHHQTLTSTRLLRLLLLGTSRYSMSSNLFGHYWQKGRSIWVDSLQAGPYGRVLYILLRAYNSRFATFGSLSCNT